MFKGSHCLHPRINFDNATHPALAASPQFALGQVSSIKGCLGGDCGGLLCRCHVHDHQLLPVYLVYQEWQESPVSTTITTLPITELDFPHSNSLPSKGFQHSSQPSAEEGQGRQLH